MASATAQWVAPAGYWGSPVVGRWGAPWVGPSATQYHAQTELGESSYGYAYPGAAANNFRDAYGMVLLFKTFFRYFFFNI